MVSSINNLIIGKIYVDHGGIMRVHSSASGLVCKLKFKEQAFMRMREPHEVRPFRHSPSTPYHHQHSKSCCYLLGSLCWTFSCGMPLWQRSALCHRERKVTAHCEAIKREMC